MIVIADTTPINYLILVESAEILAERMKHKGRIGFPVRTLAALKLAIRVIG
jgi:hypothetical protein